MERIYHRYEYWEDYKSGFYNNISGINKELMINKVVELFSSSELTETYMNKVIEKWKYSCEHNLTNLSLNRIAYLGQSACCIYAKVPSSITMEAWKLVNIKNRILADKIADRIIKKWTLNQKLKNTLNCGNKDVILMEYQMKLQLN